MTVRQNYGDNVTYAPASDFVPVLIVLKLMLILETGLTIDVSCTLVIGINRCQDHNRSHRPVYVNSARECRLINRFKGHTSVFICVITDQVLSCSTMTAGEKSDLVLIEITTNIHVYPVTSVIATNHNTY